MDATLHSVAQDKLMFVISDLVFGFVVESFLGAGICFGLGCTMIFTTGLGFVSLS